MKKIDISLVKKYVNGEDLGEFTSEQLENDKDFMMWVISYTNDIKMYSFCSESVKLNYEFVEYLVLKFKDNSEFIMTVADNYLDNADTDWENKELSIIMEKVLPKELAEKYEVLNETSYFTKRLEVEIAKAKDSKLESMVGMGFLLMFDQYNGRDIILDYYANNMVGEIIRDNNIDFEKMLHTQFKSASKITEMGINNYIVNFISCYDSMLSSYVSTHLDIIKPIANRIKRIQDDWDKYLSVDETRRYNNMLDMVHEYMSMSDSNMGENEVLYYVANELRIKEKVKQYDGSKKMEENFKEEYGYDFSDAADEEVMEDMVRFEIERNIKERLVYLTVKKIVINQLFSDKPSDLYSLVGDAEQEQPNGKTRHKVIKFNSDDKK
mgnify:CR=1 FL=1